MMKRTQANVEQFQLWSYKKKKKKIEFLVKEYGLMQVNFTSN